MGGGRAVEDMELSGLFPRLSLVCVPQDHSLLGLLVLLFSASLNAWCQASLEDG